MHAYLQKNSILWMKFEHISFLLSSSGESSKKDATWPKNSEVPITHWQFPNSTFQSPIIPKPSDTLSRITLT